MSTWIPWKALAAGAVFAAIFWILIEAIIGMPAATG